jgi:putative serine/threonine protein kinase
MRQFFPIEVLAKKPYSIVLGYPKATGRQLRSRLVELKSLGINSVSFQGPILIGKTAVLGKGYTGVVVLAKKGTRKVALKIRRTDSSRESMEKETMLLKVANKIKVGPKLIQSSNNFIVMEYLDGKKIYDWISDLKGKGSATKLKFVIKKVLQDCHNLDRLGLDHGELSNITKHVIIGRSITIVDFESSSLERKVSNVTSATQAILIGSAIAKMVKKIYNVPPKQKIIKALRQYKEDRTQESFEKLLEVLKV